MEAGMKRAQLTPTEEEARAAAVSCVLGNEDLLREILLGLGFPTTLVRAALVCRRWYRVAANPDFLHRFRELHPPRLLGFYLSTSYYGWKRLLEFVPMVPQLPELATVLRRGSFSFDPSMCISNCRTGRVVVGSYVPEAHKIKYVVHTPLYPMRSPVILPHVGHRDNDGMCRWELLTRESGDELSYFWFIMDFYNSRGADVCVYMLQDDVWRIRVSASTQLRSGPPGGRKSLLVEDRLYVAATMRSILVLDLASSSLSTIMLPDGVRNNGDMMLSQAKGSGVYLVQVKELQLSIWLLKGTHGSTGDWFMVDTFCLRDMCANLRDPNCMTGDSGAYDVYLNTVGDNAEFVFLDMDQYVLFLDVRSRAMCKVYENTKTEPRSVQIHPYMMIWPPMFPALKE
ncbi:hypothetical protein EJB05_24218, partial [Eragrostis curvula]